VIHRLLDFPTFITLFQELLNHEETAVRSNALVMLGERLEEMTNVADLSKKQAGGLVNGPEVR
jgi:hypothetical protein